METISADILEYLGKYENGVLVLLNLTYNDHSSEATIFYTDEMISVTVSPKLEKKLGTTLELWPGYRDFVISILKKVIPYDEIISRLDDVDFSKYLTDEQSDIKIAEEVDEDDIKFGSESDDIDLKSDGPDQI